jgi:hypothetical protein
VTRDRLQRLVMAATALSTAAVSATWTLAPNFGAQFGPIDDHEPLRWLGPDGSISLQDAVQTWLDDTEVGDFGAALRFRPAYYLVRIVQTVLFLDNPTAWYVSTLVLFVTTCAVMGLTLGWWLRLGLRRAGVPTRPEFAGALAITAIYTLLVVGIAAWSGIVTRLGPSELLGTAMVAAAMLSSTALLSGRRGAWWGILLVSVWGAVFSKEVLLPLSLLPGIVAVGVRLTNRSRWVVALLGIVPACVVVAAVAPPLIFGGGSLYGTRADASRLSITLEQLFRVLPTYWAPAAFVAGGAVATLVVLQWKSQRRLPLAVAAAYLLSVAWFLVDALIYYGIYELPRYGMNWQLLKVIWTAGALALATSLLSKPRGWWPTGPAVALTAASVLLLVLGVLGAPDRFQSTRQSSAMNAFLTRQYQAQIDVVRSFLTENPTTSVALIVDQPTDYEPVRAVSQSLENHTQADVVAVLNPASTSLGILQEVNLPVSQVMGHEELASGKWLCVYLHSESPAVNDCSADRTLTVITWAM